MIKILLSVNMARCLSFFAEVRVVNCFCKYYKFSQVLASLVSVVEIKKSPRVSGGSLKCWSVNICVFIYSTVTSASSTMTS